MEASASSAQQYALSMKTHTEPHNGILCDTQSEAAEGRGYRGGGATEGPGPRHGMRLWAGYWSLPPVPSETSTLESLQ